MGKLQSFIPELLAKKGWNTKEFVAHCLLAGLSQDTAYRLSRGETNFNTDTLSVVASVLEVTSLGELIDIDLESEQ